MKRFFRLVLRDAFLRSLLVNFVAGCVTALVLFASIANAQNSCQIVIGKDPVTMEQAWARTEQAYGNSPHFQVWKTLLKKSFHEVENPLSLVADIPRPELGPSEALRSLEQLSQILAEEPRPSTYKKISEWVQSDEQALFLYNLIAINGVHRHQPLLRFLIYNNPSFKKATPVKGPGDIIYLLTYSFEKEGQKADITLLYKDPKYSDDEWLDLPESKRLKLLKEIHTPKRVFQPTHIVGITDLKPHYLSGFSVEADVNNTGWGWEITHKKFEIVRERAIKQVREVGAIFKEKHSIHFHIVFELARLYQMFQEFRYWFKHVNDYLALKGMVEGLHGNGLTNVVDLGSKPGTLSRLTGQDNSLPQKLEDIKKANAKFFTVGLRGDMYGQAPSEETFRIGLELRDTTRDFDQLDIYTKNLSEAITEKRWEKAAGNLDQMDQMPQLSQNIVKSLGHLQSFMKDLDHPRNKFYYADFIATADPSLHIGLIEYEKGRYFNYRTGKFEPCPPEVAERIVEARKILINDFLLMQTELKNLDMKGKTYGLLDTKNKPYTHEDVYFGVKYILHEWAKRARVHELYENF